MDTKKIQIIEMLRNIYGINDIESLKIYETIVLNKEEKEIDIIFNDLVKIVKNKNDVLKKISIDINKINIEYEELIDYKNENMAI